MKKQSLTESLNAVLDNPKLTPNEYAVLLLLKEHQGRSKPILREDLALSLGLSIRQVRAVVKSLVENYYVPIHAGQHGYFIINAESDKQRARADLLSRARSLQVRALALDSIQVGA